MRTQDFESEYPELASRVKPATLRKWRQRGEVPLSVTAKLPWRDKGLQRDMETVTGAASVTEKRDKAPDVSRYGPYWRGPAKYGHSELARFGRPGTLLPIPPASGPTGQGNPTDILDDGYARGYPGDSWQVRVYHRTPCTMSKDELRANGYPVAG